MSQNLIGFLSDFPMFENERNLFLEIENFLVNEFLVRPILVYSISQKASELHVSKCRSVLGKTDRLKLYSARLLDQILNNREDIKDIPCLEVNLENCYYYFLNLGVKGNQFYFAIFSCPQSIDIEFLKAISKFSVNHLNIITKFDELSKAQELIHIDDVTGLYNQRKLYKDLSALVEKFHKESEPFSVLFIDLDHFKRVNDNYGHLIGTKLLEVVAVDISSLLRDTDTMYRYGGDEFVVILPGAGSGAGKLVGERILNKIKEKSYAFEMHNKECSMKLSVSIGVAEFPTDAKSSEEVLAIADRMMYEAKESGRGVVFNTHDVFKTALQKLVPQET
jgi:diguanylate cyclase (GGDEF)-like protein